jgi:hypothetical protein
MTGSLCLDELQKGLGRESMVNTTAIPANRRAAYPSSRTGRCRKPLNRALPPRTGAPASA